MRKAKNLLQHSSASARPPCTCDTNPLQHLRFLVSAQYRVRHGLGDPKCFHLSLYIIHIKDNEIHFSNTFFLIPSVFQAPSI